MAVVPVLNENAAGAPELLPGCEVLDKSRRLSYISGCGSWMALLHWCLPTRNGCTPASRCRHGGFVRLIRSVYVARVFALLIGLGVSAAAIPAESAQKRSTRAKSSATRTIRKPAYSATASKARRARLARARAAARAREQARLRALQEAMTPRYRTDAATGALVPDVRAAAAIVFNPETGQVLWAENAQ